MMMATAPFAVSFAQAGDVDATLDSSIVDENTAQTVTQTQKGSKYFQLYHFKVNDAQTTWPASGTLSLVLKTNANYTFVRNSAGTVDVSFGGKTYKAKVLSDQKIQLDDLPALSTSIAADNDQIVTEVQATGTDDSLKGKSTMTIVMGSGNNIRQASTVLPVPQENLATTTNILIPSFTFGSYGITQFMTGFTDEGTATTDDNNKLAVTTDGTTSNVKMTVALNPVADLAPGYNGGKVQLKFDFGGTNVDLTDDGTAKQLFSESTIPDTSVGKTPVLTVGKVPNVTTGAKSASLTWTVAVTPPVAAATK